MRVLRQSAFLAIFATVLWLWPAIAEACPVCFNPTEESRMGFILTTVFLTVLPLSMIGGMVYWLVRRSRALDAQSQSVPTELSSEARC